MLPAAAPMLRAISEVVAACSSTAAAMLVAMAASLLMVCAIEEISSTDFLVASWMAAICWEMSSVAREVWLASALTSDATTAKPRPVSPARAASMVALSASRLVCEAICEIRPTTDPMRSVASARERIDWLVRSASPTAARAMSTPLLACCPISLIEADSSSVAETLFSTLRVVSTEAVEADAMRSRVSSVARRTMPEVLVSDTDVSLIAAMISPIAPSNWAMAPSIASARSCAALPASCWCSASVMARSKAIAWATILP